MAANQGNVPQPPVAQNPPQIAQVVPPPPNPVQFALFPGASGNGVLDFTISESIKIFNKATASIETKYDLEEGKLRVFI
jgi:hypothetical protein